MIFDLNMANVCYALTLFLDLTFQYCVASEGHYLSQNGVSELEGISTLVNLPILNVSLNKLMNANDIQNLTWFHEFRISHHMQHGYGFQGDNLVTSLD